LPAYTDSQSNRGIRFDFVFLFLFSLLQVIMVRKHFVGSLDFFSGFQSAFLLSVFSDCQVSSGFLFWLEFRFRLSGILRQASMKLSNFFLSFFFLSLYLLIFFEKFFFRSGAIFALQAILEKYTYSSGVLVRMSGILGES